MCVTRIFVFAFCYYRQEKLDIGIAFRSTCFPIVARVLGDDEWMLECMSVGLCKCGVDGHDRDS